MSEEKVLELLAHWRLQLLALCTAEGSSSPAMSKPMLLVSEFLGHENPSAFGNSPSAIVGVLRRLLVAITH